MGAGRTPAPQGFKARIRADSTGGAIGRFRAPARDGVGARGGPGDFQRRQLFRQDLAVDAAGKGAQEPTAGEEDQGEARLRQPTVPSFGVPPEDTEGTRDDAGDGEGADLGLPRRTDGDVEGGRGPGLLKRNSLLLCQRTFPSNGTNLSLNRRAFPSSRIGVPSSRHA